MPFPRPQADSPVTSVGTQFLPSQPNPMGDAMTAHDASRSRFPASPAPPASFPLDLTVTAAWAVVGLTLSFAILALGFAAEIGSALALAG